MLIGRIEGATRYLGAPKDWKPDKDGTCGHLAIRDIPAESGANVMVSAWMPTPAEVAAIQRGEPVYLYVWGAGHPPVYVGVPGVTD
jgi:hypothetical protein